MARCVVLVPYARRIEPMCERGLRELERRGVAVWRHAATDAIDRTRSELATRALSGGFEELMWIDADVSFDPDDVDRLRALDLPIVGGVYAKKGARSLAVHALPGTRELVVVEGGGPCRVRYAAAGFLCTRRVVYDDVRRVFALPVCDGAVVPYFLPMVVADASGYWYLGEDYAFCERAHVAGHATVVDTSIRLGHVGPYVYDLADAVHGIERVTGARFGQPT